jgi:hypothetical protein
MDLLDGATAACTNKKNKKKKKFVGWLQLILVFSSRE